LRSQLLSLLYQAVRRGEMTKKDAGLRLNYVRGLPIRLLGDRVLQNVAWQVADQLGWPDTLDAEYVALTKLQADALITLNPRLADAVKDLVTVAPIEALSLAGSDVGDDGPGQAQVVLGGDGSWVVAERPVDLPQHHVREVCAGRPWPGQVQQPGAQRAPGSRRGRSSRTARLPGRRRGRRPGWAG
jgi:hypothetical protein